MFQVPGTSISSDVSKKKKRVLYSFFHSVKWLCNCRITWGKKWEITTIYLRCCRALPQGSQSVQSLSHVWLFVTPWIAARQASLSITNSQSLLKLMFIELVMQSNHLILCCHLPSCLQSFQALGSFPMSQFFASGGQSIGVSASASVLPMNTQDWSPLGWTGWISLQFKGLARVFSNTTVQKHQFFSVQLSL